MAQAQRYRLKLSKLDFVSLVDDPAQPNAKTLLIKRKGAKGVVLEGETHAKFVKANDELGVAFFWAFTSTNPDGTPHYDHHGDSIDEGNLVKIAMDFMTAGGAVDEMHDESATDARCVAFPMDPDIAKAFGVETQTSGIMVMIKLTDEQLEKLKDGTYTGVSIGGVGTREPIDTPTTNQLAARKTALESPRSKAATTVNTLSKETKMTTEEEKIVTDLKAQVAELKAKLDDLLTASATDTVAAVATEKRLARLVKMTGAQKSHFDMLPVDEQEAFLAKSNADREGDIAKALAADPIEVEFDGAVYRKSSGSQMIALAKSAKAAHEKNESQEIEKQATAHLGNIAGDKTIHAAIVRAVHAFTKSDLELRGKMLSVLDGANAIAKGRGTAAGSNGADVADSANEYEALTKGLVAFCKSNAISKVWTEGLDKFKATPEGAALKKAHDASLVE